MESSCHKKRTAFRFIALLHSYGSVDLPGSQFGSRFKVIHSSTFLFKTKWSLPDQNHSQRHRKSEQDSRILLNGSTKALDFKFPKQQIGQLSQTQVVLTWIIKPKIMGLFMGMGGKKFPSAWRGMKNNWQLQQRGHGCSARVWLTLKRPVRAKCLLRYSNSVY